MPKISASVSHGSAQRPETAAIAQRTDVSNSAERALDGHAESLVLDSDSKTPPKTNVDWGNAKRTMQSAHCSYRDCPFGDDCPPDLCRL